MRRFFVLFALSVLSILTLPSWGQDRATTSAPQPPLSPVIWTEHPSVIQRFAADPERVRDMLNTSLCTLTSASNVGVAWTRLGITPKDIVGIKITAAGGPLFCTHRVLLDAIVGGLKQAGVPANHVIIWDKFRSDMLSAGFSFDNRDDDRPRIASIFPGTGYDPNQKFKNESVGSLIWGDLDFLDSANDLADQAAEIKLPGSAYNFGTGDRPQQSSDISYYAKLESQICTKLINVPVLVDNPGVGINGCLASLALGSVDNNRRFQGQPAYGDPAISEILDRDFIRRKVVVHILDALIAQYAGDPVLIPNSVNLLELSM